MHWFLLLNFFSSVLFLNLFFIPLSYSFLIHSFICSFTELYSVCCFRFRHCHFVTTTLSSRLHPQPCSFTLPCENFFLLPELIFCFLPPHSFFSIRLPQRNFSRYLPFSCQDCIKHPIIRNWASIKRKWNLYICAMGAVRVETKANM